MSPTQKSKSSAKTTRRQPKKKTVDPTQISITFTEKHHNFFTEEVRVRIFGSRRTPFNKAMERFNDSFAKLLGIYNPKTDAEYELFIMSAPQRVLAVPEGKCEVVVSGSWNDMKEKKGRSPHAVMVYNENGHYLIFNANDARGFAVDDGFFYCYHSDNDLFDRPLKSRKEDLHDGFDAGACFVISYALKILCEKMPLEDFLKLVKTKSLEEIMQMGTKVPL